MENKYAYATFFLSCILNFLVCIFFLSPLEVEDNAKFLKIDFLKNERDESGVFFLLNASLLLTLNFMDIANVLNDISLITLTSSCACFKLRTYIY